MKAALSSGIGFELWVGFLFSRLPFIYGVIAARLSGRLFLEFSFESFDGPSEAVF